MSLTKLYSAKEILVTCHECGHQHQFFTVDKRPLGFICTNCQSIFTLSHVADDGSFVWKLSGYCQIHYDQLS